MLLDFFRDVQLSSSDKFPKATNQQQETKDSNKDNWGNYFKKAKPDHHEADNQIVMNRM